MKILTFSHYTNMIWPMTLSVLLCWDNFCSWYLFIISLTCLAGWRIFLLENFCQSLFITFVEEWNLKKLKHFNNFTEFLWKSNKRRSKIKLPWTIKLLKFLIISLFVECGIRFKNQIYLELKYSSGTKRQISKLWSVSSDCSVSFFYDMRYSWWHS